MKKKFQLPYTRGPHHRTANRTKLISEVLERSALPHSVVLHHGTSVSALRGHQPGKTVHHNRLLSASLDPDVAMRMTPSGQSALLHISVPKGHQGLYIQPWSQVAKPEHEVLLPQGTRYRVTRRENVGSVPHVYAEVESAGQQDAFNPAEPRDPEGQWTSGGGSHTQEAAKKLVATDIKWTTSQRKNALLAANALTAAGFKAMTDNPSGAKTNKQFAAIGSRTNGILVNPASPFWKDPVAAAQHNFKVGHLSTDNPVGVLLHEIAHTIYDPPSTWMADVQKKVALEVSRYAAMNPREFVSEVFAGIKTGKSYSDAVMKLFGIMSRQKD